MGSKMELGTGVCTSHWGALSCRDLQTSRLESELAEQGLKPWVPRLTIRMRLPHKRNPSEVEKLVLPGFVFLPFHEVRVALTFTKLRMVTAPYRILMLANEWAQIPDRQMIGLRELSAQNFVKAKESLEIGARVVVKEGPFMGFAGKVQSLQGVYHVVKLDQAFLPLKIPALLLERMEA